MSRRALLVVDVQNDFVHPSGKVGTGHGDVRAILTAVDAINDLVRAAREAGAEVAYIRVTHAPEVDTPAYRARYAVRGMSVDDLLCAENSWGADLYEGLEPPASHDLTVTKHGYDAFALSDLSDRLSERGVDTIVVTGVVTELCVLGTASGGFERGFHVVVPRESTASTDPEAAEAALELIAKYYGSVVTVAEALAVFAQHDVASTSGR